MEDLPSLVTRAKEGDVEAYGVVVQRCQGMALSCARSRLHDEHLAEDAVQEAFVRLDLTDLRQSEAFPSWLKRIVFKYCDRVTRRKKLETISLEYAAEIRSDALSRMRSSGGRNPKHPPALALSKGQVP